MMKIGLLALSLMQTATYVVAKPRPERFDLASMRDKFWMQLDETRDKTAIMSDTWPETSKTTSNRFLSPHRPSHKLQTMRQIIAKQLEDAKPGRQDKKKQHRNLQGGDPCTATPGDTVYAFNGLRVFLPSFFETCAESINVDNDAMLLHIASLEEIFDQYQ